MARRMPEEGRVFVQAESELAAINMALGASAAGAQGPRQQLEPGHQPHGRGDVLHGRLAAARRARQRDARRPGPRQHRRRAGRLPPGDEGPRPRRLPGARAGAVVDRRGHRPRPRRIHPGRALPHAGDPARRRDPGPGDGAGGSARSRRSRRVVRTGSSTAPPIASPRVAQVAPPAARGPRGARHRAPGRLRSRSRPARVRWAGEQLDDAERRARRVRHGGARRPDGRRASRGTRASGPACSGRSRCGRSRPQALRDAASGARAVLAVEMSAGQMVEDVRLAIEGAVPVYHHGRMGGMVPSPDEVVDAMRHAWTESEEARR